MIYHDILKIDREEELPFWCSSFSSGRIFSTAEQKTRINHRLALAILHHSIMTPGGGPTFGQ